MSIFLELPVIDVHNHPEEDLESPLSPSRAAQIPVQKKPDWIRVRPPAGDNYLRIKDMLRERKLHTVCEEAHCPNLSECWASGTATFMIGSEVCTRACRFCAIQTARIPPPLDPKEPKHVAESVAALKLKYVVLTSVDRDDLDDQGANHFAETIREIKRLDPSIIVEALVPDFRGEADCIKIIVDSGVDVYAHNVETVKRLQYRVRDPRAGYLQSIGTLRAAKNYARSVGRDLYTKTSIMLGLGETHEELLEAYSDIREFDVDVLTLGQYLRPSLKHLPVERFVSPEDFKLYEQEAMQTGFMYVASGPMVRSSYKAAEFFIEGMIRNKKQSKERANGIQAT